MKKHNNSNYWKDWNNVQNELVNLISKYDHFPVASEFRQPGYYGLYQGIIKYHGGILKARDRMGIELVKKPNNYWKDERNVIKKLKEITKQLGHFPTQLELAKIGESGLGSSITRYHGGLRKIREKIGQPYETKPNGYWRDFNNVKKELKPLIKKLGYFPTPKELKKENHALLSGITAHHNGLVNIRTILGYESKRKPIGYWTKKNIRKELEKIITKIGHFPLQEELKENGLGSLFHAIHRNYGSIGNLREELGYDRLSKPKNYWKNWRNVKSELEKRIEILGHFPISLELRGGGLYTAIQEYHGGIFAVRHKLGYENLKKPQGYWRNINNVKKQIRVIIDEIGHFPTQKEIISTRNGSLVAAITKYHGGLHKLRENMGYENKKRSHNYWKDRKNLKNELKVLTKKLGHFPSATELVNSDNTAILNGISKYHGGMINVREMMGYKQAIRPRGYWSKWENVENAIKQLIKKLGHFPSYGEISDSEYASLTARISQYGGVSEVREKMGYKQREVKPNGYWKKEENVIKDLKEVIKQLGHFPKAEELKDLNQNSLLAAILDFGGMDKFRNILGYQSPIIKDREQLISFLQKDNIARNLAAAVVMLDGNGHEIEQVISDIYEDRFKNQQSLHNLLQESTNEVYRLIEEGITNLGYYIGPFSLNDRNIVPVLIGEALSSIPEEKINRSLEDRLIRILRTNYGPRFNEDPTNVLKELKQKSMSGNTKKRRLYKNLHGHYQEVLKLQETLV